MDKVVQTGVYQKQAAVSTSSPSMDISKASNFERLVFEIFGHDPILTRNYMGKFEISGRVDFSDFGVDNFVLQSLGFNSGYSDHRSRLATIRRVWSETGKVIDPHTADAVFVAHTQTTGSKVPTLVYSTADQVKFEPMTHEALGDELLIPPRDEEFVDIEAGAKDGFRDIPADPEVAKDYLRKNFLASA
jgi:threonine synthase